MIVTLERIIRGMPLTLAVDVHEMEIVDVSLTKTGKSANWFKLSEKEIADILAEA